MILILEDLHWADPSTLELLPNLAYRASRASLLIIATYRIDEAAAAGSSINQLMAELEARGACEIVELSRLDEESIHEYLERRFKLAEGVGALASLLFNATEGHPLFVVSLVQLFVQRGDLRQTGDVWGLAVPASRLQLAIPRTVEAVIRRKLSTLDQSDRRLLQYASVEGQEFSTAVLSTLTGTDPILLEERLDVVVKRPRLITAVGPEQFPDGTWATRYQFAHALYQNVVYEELTPGRRANLHKQVGERLAQLNAGRTGAMAAQLARHFKEGRDWHNAFEYYVQAGDNSMTLSAAREAEAHYTRAIELANFDRTRFDSRPLAIALRKRATTRGFLGNAELALTDYREALMVASQAGERELMFELRLDTIYAHALAGQIDAALATAANLEQDVEPSDGLKRLRYLLAHSQMQIAAGNLNAAATEADCAVALAQSLGERVRHWHSLTVRAQVGYYRAQYTSALKDLHEVSTSTAASLRGLADPRPANIHFHGTAFLGRILGDLGRISEALATLQSGLEIARTDGSRYWIPRFANAIDTLLGEVGAVDGALQDDGEVADETVDQTNETLIESLLNSIRGYVRLRRLDRAADLLAEADTLTRTTAWYHWLWRTRFAATSAEDALVRGAPARATDFAQQSNTLARAHDLWKDVVIAERLLADAAAAGRDWPRARAHVQRAEDILTVHPVPILAWRVHATAARISWRSGRHDEAATARDRALDEIRQLSERIHDEKLRTTFLESPEACQLVNERWRE